MAKNLFYVCDVIMPDEEGQDPFYDMQNMPLRTVSMRELLSKAQYHKLDLKYRWALIGDMDVSGLITKKEKIEDSFFPYLVIHGDFKCSKYSKSFPRIVCGCVDCSNCGKDYIDNDIVLPVFAKEMNCAYSVRGFDVLMGVLPNDLETLIVEPKLIKKSYLLQNQEHLENVLAFMRMYPNLNVQDTGGIDLKDVLQEIVKEIETKKNQTQEPENKKEEIKEDLPIKVSGKNLDRRDINMLCRMNPDFESLSDEELMRFVRVVLSGNRRNGIVKQRMKRGDGAIVDCITADQLPAVYADIKLLAREREKTQVIEETPVEMSDVEFEEQIPLSKSDVKPIKIKKYISLSQYKKVVSASSIDKADTALRVINDINLDPLDIKLQGTVRLLKDGANVPQKVNTVKKESGCCLVQSIDSNFNNDPKRLVWRVADGPSGLIFVCVGFSPEHNTQTSRDIYRKMRESAYKKRTYTDQELIGFADVQDLLDNSSYGKADGDNAKDEAKVIDSYDSVSDLILSQGLDILRRKY